MEDKTKTGDDLFQDYPKEARSTMLKGEATSVETQEVRRAFSQEELDKFKEEACDDMVKVAIIEDKKAKFLEEIAAELKPLKLAIGTNIGNLRSKVSVNKEEVYLIADHEHGNMNVFDAEGIHLHSRKLLPSERQLAVMAELKTGTNE